MVSCSNAKEQPEPADAAASCALSNAAFEVGDPNGHPDPFGARAAKQARASRIRDGAAFPQPAHGATRIETGDFVLINDRIAIVIEDKGPSDGYGRFGGEILAIDRVGDDGKPMGLSRFGETLFGVAFDTINPTSVSVVKDGSDGREAIVRVTGPLQTVPFLSVSLKALYPNNYQGQFAYDYVLSPGSPMVTIRHGVINPTTDDYDFGVQRPGSEEFFGFFQTSYSQMVTPETGYGKPRNTSDWVGFDGGPASFAWRTVDKPSMSYGIGQSGFELFSGEGFIAPGCQRTMLDRVQIIAGGPDYDGLREAVREALEQEKWRAIKGTLRDAADKPVSDAWIHGLDAGGAYLTRTRTAADGTFTLHAPSGASVKVVPQKRGYPPSAGSDVVGNDVALSFAPHAVLKVVSTDAATKKGLPVRVQVIPKEALPPTPAAWGVLDEVDGRLHQDFAMNGESLLIVPPGEHRVLVSRGYEWELFDTTVTVAAGETREIRAELTHSVASTGVMCADFHIHSMYSSGSDDPVAYKVRGAIADGLDIPVAAEHDFVIDFQPVILELGLTEWAFGMAAAEVTTFNWGHLGVVPLTPDGKAVNRGAPEWIGKTPGQLFADSHARAEKPAVIVHHPRSDGFQGYFSATRYNRTTNTGDPQLWSDQFDVIEVFNDSDFESNRGASVADWFAFLNLGRKMIAVGSSDSHGLRTSPVGYPRTCLGFGHDDPSKLTPMLVRDVLLGGDAVVSGGLFMTVRGPGGERPGQKMKAPGDVTITVESPSFVGDVTLETIVNGKTVSTTPLVATGGGPAKRYQHKATLPAATAKYNWVVFHAKASGDLAPLHPGRKPFAASNPLFLE